MGALEYKELAARESKIIVGGRLGSYRYYDMRDVINAALELVEKEVHSYRGL